ncbi:MAG: DUF2946 domain-containing protein [Betaproteobacteria bacterium]|nr:DUF2946 domain-containing protein [Betaproteobacteria bacterium]
MVRPHYFAGNCAAWLAIFAMALNALWPLIAQAKPGEAAPLFESRTESALHHGEHGNHGDSAPSEPSPLTPYCGFCSLTGGAFATLVGDPPANVVSIDAEEFGTSLPEVRPVAVFTYPAAYPRAPPVLS